MYMYLYVYSIYLQLTVYNIYGSIVVFVEVSFTPTSQYNYFEIHILSTPIGTFCIVMGCKIKDNIKKSNKF